MTALMSSWHIYCSMTVGHVAHCLTCPLSPAHHLTQRCVCGTWSAGCASTHWPATRSPSTAWPSAPMAGTSPAAPSTSVSTSGTLRSGIILTNYTPHTSININNWIHRMKMWPNFATTCIYVCVSSDGGFSPQLQGDRRDLWGVLERHRGQSRSQCVRRIGKLCCWSSPSHTS